MTFASELDEFVLAFRVWPEAMPYIGMIVDEAEMRLVVRAGGRLMTAREAAEWLNMPEDEAAGFLARCYSRGIVNKRPEDGGAFSASDFYGRLDFFCKYENWDDIPATARWAINRRYLDEFIAKQRPKVQELMRSGAPSSTLPNGAVLLLHEVEEMLDAATEIVVTPCDCRRLGQNCSRPTETCLAMDESAARMLDRGHGRRLTREEAKALVRRADRKGLMHTGDADWRTRGLHELCNCCACDCYPFRAAAELGTKGFWPKSRYVAVFDRDECNLCGACVRRCHFAAFYHADATVRVKDKVRQDVRFDPTRCWGCGLCANTCPNKAITMQSV